MGFSKALPSLLLGGGEGGGDALQYQALAALGWQRSARIGLFTTAKSGVSV